MPAAERQENVIRYTPVPVTEPDERDLILLEQEEWKRCGILTWGGLARYLRAVFSAFGSGGGNYVDCCGYGADLRIPLYVYELADDVTYDLRTTAGALSGGELETVRETETASFNLTREAELRHPVARVVKTRWLTGPWTTGGADAGSPELEVEGRTVRSPIPLFGLVELTMQVRRLRHILTIPADEAEELLANGWAEFAVALVDGGRPVGLEITPPPGAEELAKNGEQCGRGGSHYKQTEPEDQEPTAQPEDKLIRCDYCEIECEDPDEKGNE